MTIASMTKTTATQKKRAVMHSFPMRTVWGMLGNVGTPVLLEFGIVHSEGD